jgi:hypothetical protein
VLRIFLPDRASIASNAQPSGLLYGKCHNSRGKLMDLLEDCCGKECTAMLSNENRRFVDFELEIDESARPQL